MFSLSLRGFVGLPVSFLSHRRRSSLSSSSFVSIGSGERQQSGRPRGGFVEDRNERIQRGKRPRLLRKTDIVFFSLSLSLFKLSFSFSLT